MVDVRDPVVVVEPAVEPVGVSEALVHLNAEDDPDERVWIATAIRAARLFVENFTGRALVEQTLEWALDSAPAGVVAVPRPPLITVVSITWADSQGVGRVMGDGDYMVDTRSTPGRIKIRPDRQWPEPHGLGGLVIQYRAGYGSLAQDVPADIRQAVLMFAAHLYENREAVTVMTGGSLVQVPLGVERLLWPYRVF